MNKANSRRIILLLLALAFVIPIVAQMQSAPVVINAPARFEVRSRPKPSPTKIPLPDAPKISPELEAKLVALLKATSKEAASLNLPENRIRYLSDAADLLWVHDEKTARDLFANAANDLRGSVQSLDAFYQRREAGEVEEDSLGGMFFGGGGGESRKSFSVNAVRQNLLLTLAKRDGSAALALFRETERDNYKDYNWNDKQFEAKLGSIIAKNDSARALEIGMRKLSKNDFEGMDDLVVSLYRKDAEKGAQLAAETVKKLKTAESPTMMYGRDPLNALFDKATEITDETNKTKADQPPMLSEADLRELADVILKKRIKRVKQDKYAYYDEYDTSERLKKYAPVSYAQLERENKSVQMSSGNSPMGNMGMMSNIASDSGISGSSSMTNSNVMVATLNGNTVSSGISARESAEQAQAAAMSELMEAAKSPDSKISLEEARKNLNAIRNRQQRLLALTQIAKAFIARGDKDSAKVLLADAAEMQIAQPRKATEMLQNLMLADAYSAIEPDRSFTMMESTIFEFNNVATALLRMVEFADVKEVADGEFNMGIIPKDATESLGSLGLQQPLFNLATADFERTAALADKFERPELRAEARMLIVRTLLPPEKEQ